MRYIKYKDITIHDGIKNQTPIKRDFMWKYGIKLENEILRMSEDFGLAGVSVDISKGEPWFGKNGMLDVSVKILLLNDDSYTLTFSLHWNHTSFVTDPKALDGYEWW